MVTGAGLISSEAPLPELDLCVMNPPFGRSVGGNALFGSLPLDREDMQKALRELLNRKGDKVAANTNAGLGSVFTAVADRHIKPGGRLALVLPAAITTGISWAATRALIELKYDLESVVASHEADHWNFSENTDLSEVLLVARNEGADIGAPDRAEHGVSPLHVGERKFGELIAIRHAQLSSSPWIGCSFAQTELVRSAWYLGFGHLLLPGDAKVYSVAVRRLGDLAVLGPDRRDIYDGFQKSDSPTAYPALWSHQAGAMKSVAAIPNAWLSPRSKPASGRPKRPVELLWPKAGNVMIAERLRLNTQRVCALLLSQKALSNVWWPVNLKSTQTQVAKALALWFNSSLGLMLLVAHRVPTEGSWVSFKKPSLEAMPVLDVSALSTEHLDLLDKTYQRVSEQELLPFAQIASDEVRAEIDAAFASIFGVGDLTIFAEMLGREPVITNKSIGIAAGR